MRPLLPLAFEQSISKPRLDSYKSYFRTTSVEESIGLYMWNIELSACFNALLSNFEIVLRNNIHRAMSTQYCGGSASGHWYDLSIKAQLKPETLKKVDDVRYTGHGRKRALRRPAPNPDEIVSRVSFGFWPSILKAIPQAHAHLVFPAIFPNHVLSATPADWGDAAKRKSALAFIYELNEFRNRLAHHEPLWKFGSIYDTSVRPPALLMRASNNHIDSFARFQRLISFLDGAIFSMNQGLHSDLVESSWRTRLNFLLTNGGLARYRTGRYCPADQLLTPTEFRRKFAFVVKENQPVRIGRSQGRGLFIPD